MFIIGFDPSLNGTGYAVLDVTRKPKLVECGTVKGRNKTWGKEDTTQVKLSLIASKTKELVAKYRPAYPKIFFERGFSNQYNNSTQATFRARGAIESELVGFEIVEYPPTKVKSILGKHGFSSKEGVRDGVCKMLNIPTDTFETDDESDATAVALCGWLEYLKGD